MKTEVTSVTKSLYKIELLLIKTIPYIISVIYFINSVLSYFNIENAILSYIGGMSILPFIFLYISSFVFKFCIYHRIPLYYILVCDIINYYDYYIGIPVNARNLLTLNIIIFSIFMLLLVYFKFKQHESRTSK